MSISSEGVLWSQFHFQEECNCLSVRYPTERWGNSCGACFCPRKCLAHKCYFKISSQDIALSGKCILGKQQY